MSILVHFWENYYQLRQNSPILLNFDQFLPTLEICVKFESEIFFKHLAKISKIWLEKISCIDHARKFGKIHKNFAISFFRNCVMLAKGAFWLSLEVCSMVFVLFLKNVLIGKLCWKKNNRPLPYLKNKLIMLPNTIKCKVYLYHTW